MICSLPSLLKYVCFFFFFLQDTRLFPLRWIFMRHLFVFFRPVTLVVCVEADAKVHWSPWRIQELCLWDKMISTAFPQSLWQEAGTSPINKKKGINVSLSLGNFPLNNMPGGFYCRAYGDLITRWDRWTGGRCGLGGPGHMTECKGTHRHTSHRSHGSCIHVSLVIYLYLQWSPLNRALSNSKDINQWVIWPCANLQKIFKTLFRWPCMVEKQAFPHNYLYSGTRMKCPRLSILQS